jgi:SpoVK/Ycf46/Vps4 family AAA+-type ATPase
MPRGRGEKKWEDDTANTLLGLLDGVKSDKGQGVIWVVASNFDDASTEMDEAMLRRFSVKINFRLPNKTERRELLRSFLSRKKEGLVDWDDLDLDQVAEITANLSPALLETVVDARQHAVDPGKNDHQYRPDVPRLRARHDRPDRPRHHRRKAQAARTHRAARAGPLLHADRPLPARRHERWPKSRKSRTC